MAFGCIGREWFWSAKGIGRWLHCAAPCYKMVERTASSCSSSFSTLQKTAAENSSLRTENWKTSFNLQPSHFPSNFWAFIFIILLLQHLTFFIVRALWPRWDNKVQAEEDAVSYSTGIRQWGGGGEGNNHHLHRLVNARRCSRQRHHFEHPSAVGSPFSLSRPDFNPIHSPVSYLLM